MNLNTEQRKTLEMLNRFNRGRVVYTETDIVVATNQRLASAKKAAGCSATKKRFKA